MKAVTMMICLTLLLAVTGCTTTKMTRTGFLDSYSNLRESPRYPGMLVDRTNVYKITNYKKFMIDPVIVYFSPYSERIGINSQTIKDMTDYFDQQLVKALEDKYEIVHQPGRGVLRIRIAVTDVVPSTPALNVHWATKLTKAGVGGASIEAEFIDSISHERIAALTDSRMGRSLQVHKGFSKWGYSKDAFLQWAKMLRERLDEFHSYK